MSACHHTIRDDDECAVIVGWDEELESYYACVFPTAARTGEPLLAAGQSPHEITTLSHLARVVTGYAPIDDATASALRRERTPAPR
jgi:hypothetical protein